MATHPRLAGVEAPPQPPERALGTCDPGDGLEGVQVIIARNTSLVSQVSAAHVPAEAVGARATEAAPMRSRVDLRI